MNVRIVLAVLIAAFCSCAWFVLHLTKDVRKKGRSRGSQSRIPLTLVESWRGGLSPWMSSSGHGQITKDWKAS